jgi:23S rRNA pseudouridine2605 synthase
MTLDLLARSNQLMTPASKLTKTIMKRRPEPGRGQHPAADRPDQAKRPDRRKRSTRGQSRAARPAEKIAEPPQKQAERLQKVMAAAGLGSRRALEQHIRSGEIQLNGSNASLGQTVKIGDRLQWGDREWRVVAEQSQHRSLIYNKPEGEITSRSDPEGRITVFDRLPHLKNARWVAIGRLDINTTGLLLLTTDGELANAMMHPSSQVDREYVCRVRGLVSDEQVEQLKTGVVMDDGPANFNDIRRMGGPDAGAYGKPSGKAKRQGPVSGPSAAAANQWFQVTLLEGRNREVRRLWEALGHMVSRLKRVRYGAAMLPRGLKVGHWHEVSAREHQVLREDVGLATAQAELILQSVGAATDARKTRARIARDSDAQDHAATGPQYPRKGGRPGTPSTARRTGQGKHTTRSADLEKPRHQASKPPTGKPRIAKPGSPVGGGRRPASTARSSKPRSRS